MKKKITIILLEDIKSLGRAGQIVTVAEGYARNILFPQGKAALATPDIRQKQTEAETASAATQATELSALREKAEQLTGTELTLVSRVKDGDEIYGKITPKEIAKEINSQAKLNLTAKQVRLSAPITKLGSQDVEIALSPDVIAVIRVTVMADPDSLPSHEEE